MIKLVGPEDASEYHAACQLRDLIAGDWPEVAIEANVDDQVYIVSAAKCNGQQVVDIDLVVYVNLKRLRLVIKGADDQPSIYVRSLCLTIELKEHEPDGIRIEGNQVFVRYRGSDRVRMSSATEQAHKQQASLRNFLDAHGYKPPFVTDMLWLPNVPQDTLPEACHNIVGSHATWSDFLRQIVELKRPRAYPLHGSENNDYEIDAFYKCDRNKIESTIELLTRKIEVSPLDRKKIEMLSKRRTLKEDVGYIKNLGKQLLIFRGRGGTGKTVHLLHFARTLYNERDARVLLLTYNKALVADLKRLLALMGMADVYGQRAVQVATVHSFLYYLRRSIATDQARPIEFIKNFESHRSFMLQELRKQRLAGTDPLAHLEEIAPDIFDWDYIFIDEAQDWPDEERQILFLLYGYQRFVIADGVDQYVREGLPTNWRHAVDAKQVQYVQLRKSLRLKAGLCTFAQSFAQNIELGDWQLEKDESIFGGRIIIIEGNYAVDRRLHDELVDGARVAGNAPIDMLFCVPPSLVQHGNANQAESTVGKRFRKWGYKTWDAVSYETRGSYPTSIEELRIVQYDSCRGLEGWTCVNLRFDELYDYKLRQYRPPAQMTFMADDQAAHFFAARWLMIPLTRAIDTLVIQINSADHPVGRALRAAARDCPDLVEWRVIGHENGEK